MLASSSNQLDYCYFPASLVLIGQRFSSYSSESCQRLLPSKIVIFSHRSLFNPQGNSVMKRLDCKALHYQWGRKGAESTVAQLRKDTIEEDEFYAEVLL